MEWRVESRPEDQHGVGRAGATGEESAVRCLKLQKSLRRGGGLKMQDVQDRVETEEKEGKMRGRTKSSCRSA